jgi:hypothetical protein
MFEEHDLRVLLTAYIDGDVLARKALVDILEEAGDPRTASVREEAIDWDKLARKLSKGPDSWFRGGVGYIRFLIECARFNSTARPDIVDAVRQARQQWVKKLFPEIKL